MKFRQKLTLIYTLVTLLILFVFASIIYWSASKNRELEFYNLLQKEAITKANLYLNAEVETQVLQNIYRANREILFEVEVAIYNTQHELLYHDAVDIDFVKETPEMLNQIYHEGSIAFYQDDWQVVGMRYALNNQEYLVTAAAYDAYGFNKLWNLKKNSAVIFLVSILFIALVAMFLSITSLNPVRLLIKQVESISAKHLHLRVPVKYANDELDELARTFNGMLDRLEKSFDAQRSFVSNISHELRTPLSAILAELDLALDNPRFQDNKPMVALLTDLKTDTQKLIKIVNDLLDFSKAGYDKSEIAFVDLRIDELLLDARSKVLKMNPDYEIEMALHRSVADSEEMLWVHANAYLLTAGLVNILENACKYSLGKPVKIEVSCEQKQLIVSFIDQGVGIKEEDLKRIFEPFFRAPNAQVAQGTGLGLSLTHKVMSLHGITLDVVSKPNQGSSFILTFPASNLS